MAFGGFVPLLLATLLLAAHGAVDRQEPDKEAALMLYGFGAGIAGAALLSGVGCTLRADRWALAGAVVGIPFAFVLKSLASQVGGAHCGTPSTLTINYPCNEAARFGLELYAVLLGAGLLAVGLGALLHRVRQRASGPLLALGLAAAVAFLVGDILLWNRVASTRRRRHRPTRPSSWSPSSIAPTSQA